MTEPRGSVGGMNGGMPQLVNKTPIRSVELELTPRYWSHLAHACAASSTPEHLQLQCTTLLARCLAAVMKLPNVKRVVTQSECLAVVLLVPADCTFADLAARAEAIRDELHKFSHAFLYS